MRQDALQRSWMSSVTDRLAGRQGVCATVAILLTVGGCSNFQSLIGAPQQSSLQVADAALSAGAPDLALRVADLADAKQPNDARRYVSTTLIQPGSEFKLGFSGSPSVADGSCCGSEEIRCGFVDNSSALTTTPQAPQP